MQYESTVHVWRVHTDSIEVINAKFKELLEELASHDNMTTCMF